MNLELTLRVSAFRTKRSLINQQFYNFYLIVTLFCHRCVKKVENRAQQPNLSY